MSVSPSGEGREAGGIIGVSRHRPQRPHTSSQLQEAHTCTIHAAVRHGQREEWREERVAWPGDRTHAEEARAAAMGGSGGAQAPGVQLREAGACGRRGGAVPGERGGCQFERAQQHRQRQQ